MNCSFVSSCLFFVCAMWILTKNDTQESFHLIPEKNKYTVGRTGVDLLLRNDSSISRAHACLYFEENGGALTLVLEDTGSKYGIYHREGIAKNERLNSKCILQDGDQVRFGVLNNLWSVRHFPLKTIVSALPLSQRQQVTQHLKALGGSVMDQWDATSTHLTMYEITVTIKLLHALLEQLPIVNCDYWSDFVEVARSGNAKLPLAEKYLPRRCDALMHKTGDDFGKRPERKQLFSGMTFIFQSRSHYDSYASIVQKAGGACRHLNSGVQKTFIVKEKVLVIQYVSSTQSQNSQTINSIEEYLTKHDRRSIPEYEIGLAIIHCSTEKFCNPRYKLLNDLLPGSSAIDEDTDTNTLSTDNFTEPNSQLPSESLVVLETNENTVNSVHSELKKHKVPGATDAMNDLEESNDWMPSLRISESPNVVRQQSRKRKTRVLYEDSSSENNSDNEPLSQFMKRRNLKNSSESVKSPDLGENKKTMFPLTPSTTVEDTPASQTRSHANHITLTPAKSFSKASQPFGAVKPKVATKSSPRPLPITFSNKKKNMQGFLEKQGFTQNNRESPSKKSEEEAASEVSRKRARIAVLNEDDADDDSDLFCFLGDDTNKMQNKRMRRFSSEDGDELFNFTSAATQDRVDNPLSTVQINDAGSGTEILPETEEFIPNIKSDVIMPKPKLLPQKVSTLGWLSCSLSNISVKDELPEIEDAHLQIEHEPDTQKEWLNSIKGGFEVRVAKVSHRDGPQFMEQSNFSHSAVSYIGSTKNFKVFVKKSSGPKFHKIIKTVSVPVSNQLR